MSAVPEDTLRSGGKMRRTIHLAYDMALLDTNLLDVDLTPNSPGDTLTPLAFVDHADGEMHVFVLNDDYRKRLIAGLTGGVRIETVVPRHNGG